tara:strand:+ start:4045 stop:4353 length:309 start_codon:yes stop_codon:yes gene_type:complete
MGKTKERLIQIQEEMMMGWHEDVEMEMANPMKFPTSSSNTPSKPAQTIDTEAFTDDLYDMMVERIHHGKLKDILKGIVTELLDKHMVQTGSRTSLGDGWETP